MKNHSGSIFSQDGDIFCCLNDEGQESLPCLKLKMTHQGVDLQNVELPRTIFDNLGSQYCLVSYKRYIDKHLQEIKP
jgi:hypothetical protein